MTSGPRNLPSFPSRRSRRVRDGIFLSSVLVWIGAMCALRQEGRAQPPLPVESAFSPFSADFEPMLRMRVEVRAAGATFEGEATREARYPYEGRAVVEYGGRAEGAVFGQRMRFELTDTQHWDGAGGLRMAEVRVRLVVPGVLDERLSATAEREGDYVVVGMEIPGGGRPVKKPYPLPRGHDLSGGLMEPAPVRPMEVGTRWTERTVGLSEELKDVEVQVVDFRTVEVAGRERLAFVAIARVEAATGRLLEFERLYSSDGRALRQEVPLGPAVVVLERIETDGE